MRWLLVTLGFLFVALGILGIFLPLLPTTPFLLLAAACFARSSDRFHKWLLGNRWLGDYIRNYREGRGMSRISKTLTIAALWITIAFTALQGTNLTSLRILLLCIALGVTTHLLSIPTHGTEIRNKGVFEQNIRK
jgi:uncharacterized membrane protein YbaN (DUF454 family)